MHANRVRTKTSHLGYIVRVAASKSRREGKEERNLKSAVYLSSPLLYHMELHHSTAWRGPFLSVEQSRGLDWRTNPVF